MSDEDARSAIDRMRLAECLRLLERDSPEAAALFERVPELERQLREAQAAASAHERTVAAQRENILRLESILAEDGHRIATRAAAWQERHPGPGKVLSALTRMLRRLVDRG